MVSRRVLHSILCLLLLAGCHSVKRPAEPSNHAQARTNATTPAIPAAQGPHWWNDQVFYEVFVRSFQDSATGPLANDGTGDLQGLIDRLDYLNDGNPATTTDLGVTALWLMPINPSPSYHGYDVTDYDGINPQYGTKADFDRLIAECHKRGIRVITDLVLNHTSSDHPWFRKALAHDRQFRDWYIFVDADKVPDVLGPWNQQVWQTMNGQHYFGLFWSGMPDLNYRNPAVTAEAYRIADEWLRDFHVDGFRLDAVRHLIEDGNVMADTPETLAWLRNFRAHVKQTAPDALLVGEVWTHTEAASDYVTTGALDLTFEFDLADAILKSIKTGRGDDLAYVVQNVASAYPAGQFASFVTNHDQDRIASVLGPDPARLKLAASLLLAAPGVPFIYYGEEIGQVGAKPDEMIRNPMPWTSGPNAGFTQASRPWERLQRGFERRNVAAEDADPASLLNHYRHWIRLRQSELALRQGDVQVVDLKRDGIIAWQRSAGGRTVTLIANLTAEPLEGLAVPATLDGATRIDAPDGSTLHASTPLALEPYAARLYASRQ
jgi:glycosidase